MPSKVPWLSGRKRKPRLSFFSSFSSSPAVSQCVWAGSVRSIGEFQRGDEDLQQMPQTSWSNVCCCFFYFPTKFFFSVLPVISARLSVLLPPAGKHKQQGVRSWQVEMSVFTCIQSGGRGLRSDCKRSLETHVNARWEQVKHAELSTCDRIIQGGFKKKQGLWSHSFPP